MPWKCANALIFVARSGAENNPRDPKTPPLCGRPQGGYILPACGQPAPHMRVHRGRAAGAPLPATVPAWDGQYAGALPRCVGAHRGAPLRFSLAAGNLHHTYGPPGARRRRAPTCRCSGVGRGAHTFHLQRSTCNVERSTFPPSTFNPSSPLPRRDVAMQRLYETLLALWGRCDATSLPRASFLTPVIIRSPGMSYR